MGIAGFFFVENCGKSEQDVLLTQQMLQNV